MTDSGARSPVSDFRGSEIGIAVAIALIVQIGGAIALKASSLDRPAAIAEFDKGAVPVKVIPVLDLDAPMLKLGGKRDKMKLPDRWLRQTPKPRVEEKAFASTKAGQTVDDIPDPEMKMADAGTEPPPPDADVAKQVDTEITEAPDAAVANVDVEGHADGVKEGTETDPLKARAVDVYRANIARWFQSGFHVRGSGLSPDDLKKYRVAANVRLAGLTVTSFSISPSGNAAFDAAARARLDGAVGNQIPSPPENYPDIQQNQISVTFVCNEKVCD